jgi:hypothetical protein
MRTHALGGVRKLARDFLSQQIMIPVRAIASDQVTRPVERMSFGRVIADADCHVGMKGADGGGARRQQRMAHGGFEIVGIGARRHRSLHISWKGMAADDGRDLSLPEPSTWSKPEENCYDRARKAMLRDVNIRPEV